MPPAYVKPYVKRHKNDVTDAEAICEAVTRPNMRFVATKTPEQQSCLTLHRTRHLFIRQQTSVINVIRAHLAEFGIVAPAGRHGVEQLLSVAADSNDKRLPELARACVAALGAQLQALKAQILEFDRRIRAWHQSSEASRRLDDIPGVGPALATALVASIADAKAFRCQRSCGPHLKAEHMAAPTSLRHADSSCQLGAVHTWHLADILRLSPNVRFQG
jgi:transposase